ncbi:MAG: hypothetical protein ACOYL5_05830 [Phototrophicaceae bacterium]|jgi:hypothetical protein
MALRVYWANPEKTVLVQRYVPPHNVQEAYDAVRISKERMAEVPHTVHVLNFVPLAATIQHAPKLGLARYAEQNYPPNQGYVFMISNGAPVLKAFTDAVFALVPNLDARAQMLRIHRDEASALAELLALTQIEIDKLPDSG